MVDATSAFCFIGLLDFVIGLDKYRHLCNVIQGGIVGGVQLVVVLNRVEDLLDGEPRLTDRFGRGVHGDVSDGDEFPKILQNSNNPFSGDAFALTITSPILAVTVITEACGALLCNFQGSFVL